MFRTLAAGESFSRVALVPLAATASGRYLLEPQCERLYFGGDRGVCLMSETRGLITTRYARVFDASGRVLHSVTLTGSPSRARVSPDGRWAAITDFEQGHSYAEHGFSTRTTFIDTLKGTVVTDLEQFTVWRDGAPLKAIDFNFWGVTFARDSNRFFATLATRGTP